MNLDEARKKVEEIETYAERWRRGTIPASNARELFSLTRTLIIELEQTKDALAKSRRAHDVTNEAYADEREVYALSVKKENTLQSEKAELQAEVERLKTDYEGACKTIAEMHAAAVGEIRGPSRGVVEDMADLYREKAELESKLCEETAKNASLQVALDEAKNVGHLKDRRKKIE